MALPAHSALPPSRLAAQRALALQAAWGKIPPPPAAAGGPQTRQAATPDPPTPFLPACLQGKGRGTAGGPEGRRTAAAGTRAGGAGAAGTCSRRAGGRLGELHFPAAPASRLPAPPRRPHPRRGHVVFMGEAPPRRASGGVTLASQPASQPPSLPPSLGGPCQAARRGLLNIHEARGAGGRAGSGGWLTRPLPP